VNRDPTDASAPESPTVTFADGSLTLTFQHPANRGVLFEWSPELPAGAWLPVNHPLNKLLFPAETATRTITDVLSSERRYYRMRVIEP
jgi:hypothetical protein